ncbi:hypothetical protein AH4AK4_1634 [Aeromonas hydrophila 4AK4]|nr:hypothetical protein AH4AK4_1634 [Aeromonas hydrophila 4AK4]
MSPLAFKTGPTGPVFLCAFGGAAQKPEPGWCRSPVSAVQGMLGRSLQACQKKEAALAGEA